MKNKSSVNDCKLIELPINHREKGNITVIENRKNIPFDVRRVYYLYDVPAGESRGGHAHKELKQLVIAASGSFDVILSDGDNKHIVTLNRPFNGLLIVPGIWRELDNFSSGSVCLVLASNEFNEEDYIREYEDFFKWKTL
jgi:dTDP-4-dehydrorhamnose 3,5-epimerase-like enzyme